MSKVYIGIDAGGTKTDYLMIDESGKILERESGSTIHIKQTNEENIRTSLENTINAMLDKSGKQISDVGHLFAGIPGYGEFPEVELLFNDIFSKFLSDGKYTFRNDAVAGWAGSQAARPGVNMVLGTGAIAYGIDYEGTEARSSGWGPYCGDEGSAYWLGRQAIRLFGRESDGRAPKSHLYELIKSEYKLENDFDFISIILDLEDNRTEVAKLSRLLSKAAEMGDKEAILIINKASQEVIESIKAVISKLNFTDDEDIFFSYSGGVFNIGKLLTDPIEEALTKDSRLKKVESVLQPVQGACLLALKYAGLEITDEILENLKG